MTLLMLISLLGMLLGAAGLLLYMGGASFLPDMWSAKARMRRSAQEESYDDSDSPSRRAGILNMRDLRGKIILSSLGALLVIAVTRWPVAGLLAFCAGIGIPAVISATRSSLDGGKVEAIAGWTELLRDSLASSSGLLQAIMSTAQIAPQPIRPALQRMTSRLASGMPLATAITKFGKELDDASGDIVVCALLLAASARTQKLSDLLGELAASMREEVAVRMRIEASRASAKSSVRTVVIFSAVFFIGLMLLAHSYLAPFGSVTGQLVLLCVGGCYISGVWLMLKMDKTPIPVRLLGHASSVDADPLHGAQS